MSCQLDHELSVCVWIIELLKYGRLLHGIVLQIYQAYSPIKNTMPVLYIIAVYLDCIKSVWSLVFGAENSGLHVFDFLANSILKEVLSAIQKGKPGAFSPGRPTEFLKNYKSSLDFLSHLEGSCQKTDICLLHISHLPPMIKNGGLPLWKNVLVLMCVCIYWFRF